MIPNKKHRRFAKKCPIPLLELMIKLQSAMVKTSIEVEILILLNIFIVEIGNKNLNNN
jgi:hypothetical protein